MIDLQVKIMTGKKYDVENLGHTVKMLRINRKISQILLAEKLGISQTNLSNLEHGRGIFSLKMLVTIAEIFDISMDELLSGKVNEDHNAEATYSLHELKVLLELLHKNGKF